MLNRAVVMRCDLGVYCNAAVMKNGCIQAELILLRRGICIDDVHQQSFSDFLYAALLR